MHRGLPCSKEKLESVKLHDVVPHDPLQRLPHKKGGRWWWQWPWHGGAPVKDGRRWCLSELL
jgi:hypothetical protein